MNKGVIYLIFLVINSIAIRLYFTIATGQPVSVDAWQLIKNTEIGKETGYISTEIKNIDKYNINWPLSQIFGIIISIVFGIEVKDAMRMGFPLIASLSPVILFTLSLKITRNSLISFLASLFLANYTYNVFFSSGVTKETFAYPFFIYSLITFLLIFKNKKFILIFFISAFVLLFSHHFTLSILYIILLFFLLNYLIFSIIKKKIINKESIISFILFNIFIFFYYQFYVNKEIFYFLNLSDILTFFSYQIFILLIFIKTKIINSYNKLSKKIFIIFIFFIFLYILNFFLNIFPYNYIYSSYYLISAVNYSIFLFFILLAYREIKINGDYIVKLFLLAWPASIFAFYLYAFFGANFLLSITLSKRLLNFLFPSTFLLVSYLLAKNKKYIIFSIIIIILFFVQIFYIYPLKINYSGYQWLYNEEEIECFKWLEKYHENNKVLGDIKTSYALYYYNVTVNPYESYLYFFENKKVEKSLIVLYREILKNGFVLTDYGEKLKPEFIAKIYEKSIVFSNYETVVLYDN